MIVQQTRKWCALDWEKLGTGLPYSSRAKEQDASADQASKVSGPSTKRRKKNSLMPSSSGPSKQSYREKQKNPSRYGLQTPFLLVAKAGMNTKDTQASESSDPSPSDSEQQKWETCGEKKLDNGKIAVFWKDTHYLGLQGETAFYQDLEKFRGQWETATQNGENGDKFEANIKWHVTEENDGVKMG